MAIGWLWLALGVASIVNLFYLIGSLPLQMEVWANRRVIAALNGAWNHLEQKGRLNQTKGVRLAFLLGLARQLVLLLREVWR